MIAKSLFNGGLISQTEAAVAHLTYSERIALVERHLRGDWTEMATCDRENNERAVKEGGEVISLYFVKDKYMIVRTDPARSGTVVMMSDEA